jgi:hypothetical protein
MPRILELLPLEDGRMAVVLDVPPTQDDPGNVTLWTNDERARAIKAAILAEREECCALVWGHAGSDNVAQRTVDAIRKRIIG